MAIGKKKKRGSVKKGKEVKALADYICNALAGKMIIHRYDAFSTNSVYLKFDYGVQTPSEFQIMPDMAICLTDTTLRLD